MLNEKEMLKEIRMAGLKGKIKDIEETYEYIFIRGWNVNEDQDINPGQIDNPDDDMTYYDAESAIEETI